MPTAPCPGRGFVAVDISCNQLGKPHLAKCCRMSENTENTFSSKKTPGNGFVRGTFVVTRRFGLDPASTGTTLSALVLGVVGCVDVREQRNSLTVPSHLTPSTAPSHWLAKEPCIPLLSIPGGGSSLPYSPHLGTAGILCLPAIEATANHGTLAYDCACVPADVRLAAWYSPTEYRPPSAASKRV